MKQPLNSGIGARLQHTLKGLDTGELYGVQLNYSTGSGQRVYSARDVYLWPSDVRPDYEERIATQPFFGYHADKEYRYRICNDTFFSDDSQKQSEWVALIEHAFERWEIATNGLVKVTREQTPCTDLSRIQLYLYLVKQGSWYLPGIDEDVEAEAQASEVRMTDFDATGITTIDFFLTMDAAEFYTDPFKQCIFGGKACATSKIDYGKEDRGARNVIEGGVDVTFRKSSLEDSATDIPSDPRFNTCLPHRRGAAGDYYDYGAYETAVHESGHAIGLSNVTDKWRYALDEIPLVKLLPFIEDRKMRSTSPHIRASQIQ